MAFNAPATVLPLYVRASVAPSVTRRVLILLAQLAVAAVYGFAAVALPPQMIFVLILPTAVCLLIALWLMPDRVVFPLRAIEGCFRVLLVLMIIWPVYLAVVLPGLPWLTPTRMTLFIVTFLFLYSASTSSVLRRHLAVVTRVSPIIWAAFLAWEASMLISLPFSHQVGASIKVMIDNQLRLAQMLFLGALLFARRGAATRTVAWIVVLASVCAIDGFIELHLGYPPWSNHIPSFMRVDEAFLANILGSQARTADGLYRVRGPYPNSLIFSEFLALCMPFVLHWLLTGRTLLLRAAMAGTFVLLLSAILVTQSRLGLVGTIVTVALYVPLWAFRQWRADRTSLVGPTILIGAPLMALALIGVVFSSHTLKLRVLGGGAQAASDASRAQQRQMAVPKVAANPLGHGLTQSGYTLGFANQAGQISVDNHYITTLLDLGILGALGFYSMFLAAALIGVRLYLSTVDREAELAGPLAVMMLVFLVVKFVLSQENNHGLVMLLLGMTLALAARDRGLFDPDKLFPRRPEAR